ncbi:signal protein [Pseudonocardiaceae bacterium YIM PH 21723]|nr:signal protein [Pseudonocardiaceae bacterium YIM PH 21723]
MLLTLTACAHEVPDTQQALGRNMQERWWAWASSIREADSPVTDTTGERCGKNQPSDIWFLAGTFGGRATRTCVVPALRPIYFPLVNREEERREYCDRFVEEAKGKATLDGAPVPHTLEGPTAISFITAEGNPLTGGNIRVNAWACGLWVRLEPLPAGEHKLSFEGTDENFSTAVDYTLIIESSNISGGFAPPSSSPAG